MESSGLITLLPTVVVIATAVISHRPVAALLAGVFIGVVLHSPGNIVGSIAEINLAVMRDETVGWIIMVCGLMGSLVYLLIRTGGANAFALSLAKRANTRNKSLLTTWFLGMLIFIDDYLNAIAIGSAMKQVTDKFRVSRAMLSYVVDSTAAPTCVLVPISTWAVFFAGVLEATDVAEAGQGMSLYISGIPFMIYPIIALLLVPLVATGRFPLLGLMKKAEAKAAEGVLALNPVKALEADVPEGLQQNSPWVFLGPLISLIAFSVYFDIDLLKGIMTTLALCIPVFVWMKLLRMKEALDCVMEGFKIMIPPLAIVVAAFMFKTVNDQLGLPAFVIESVQPLMSPMFLPVITFWTMALISFATGSSWGVFVIAIPIIMPLAAAVGTPTPLVIGALLSASSFGSHTCFYGDATVLSAQSSGLSVMEHALSQLPYALVAAGLASLVFLGLGAWL